MGGEGDSNNHGHEENAKCSPFGVTTFVLGLVSGTFSAITCKIAYDTKSVGLDGEEKAFSKPILMLLLMFSAMMPALVFWKIQQSQLPVEKRETLEPGSLVILIIPSVCDLMCTLLLLVAQLYITASLWQMMRGSIIIITALLKRFALGHTLKVHMWVGVGIITIAMLLVASTSFFGTADQSEAGKSKDPRIGILLVLVGCLAQGVQYVFEEKVMSDNNTPPLIVIGFEGLWGTILTLTIVYPLAYILPGSDGGRFENPYDAYAMISNSSTLQWLVIGFVFTVTIYNCMAVYVTKALSAIWHAILDNFRPITIWGVSLLIHYAGTGYGEAWVAASWLQLAGLIILLFGTAVYNGSLCTFDSYEDKNQDQSSAMMSRSPLIHKRNSPQARKAEYELISPTTSKPQYYESL